MADRIELTGIQVHANHGVLPHEAEYGQPFTIDILCWLDFAAAARDDDLTQTVNYAELAHTAVEIAEGTRRALIETVAADIADGVLAQYHQLHAVEVTIHKPHAPVGLMLKDVAVTARRSRKSAPAIARAAEQIKPVNAHDSSDALRTDGPRSNGRLRPQKPTGQEA